MVLIPESESATVLKLNNHGTTTIEGNDLRNRFLGEVRLYGLLVCFWK